MNQLAGTVVTGSPSKPVRTVHLVPATGGSAARASTPGAGSAPLDAAIETAASRAGRATLRLSEPPIQIAYPSGLPGWVKPVLWWLVALAVVSAWDRAVWLSVSNAGKPRLEWLERMGAVREYWELLKGLTTFHGAAIRDWLIATVYQVVYRFGQIFPWLVVAIVIIFRGWMGTDVLRLRQGLRRGVFVVGVPGLAGIAAELLKAVIRRARPEIADGNYAWLPYPRDLSKVAENIGLASSHVAVAVGAALAVGLVFPRTRLLCWPLAALCCLSRVLVGAHFLSDAFVGVTLAVLVYWGLRALDLRNNRGVPISQPV